jgi:hypothetical protein
MTKRNEKKADVALAEDQRTEPERRLEERRGSTRDRRSGVQKPRKGAEERRSSVVDRRLGLDRRRGPGRRRSDDRRHAEEGHMTDEQFDFLMAIDEYKRKNARPFPTWTEVLEVIKALGYRKVAEPQFLAPPKNEEVPAGEDGC